jgi:hypothetical protein
MSTPPISIDAANMTKIMNLVAQSQKSSQPTVTITQGNRTYICGTDDDGQKIECIDPTTIPLVCKPETMKIPGVVAFTCQMPNFN